VIRRSSPGRFCWRFNREVVIIERVSTGAWTPKARTCRQFACAAAVAMLVLVVNSIHIRAASDVHDDSAAAATSVHIAGAPTLEADEFLEHAGAIAGCMTLEFAAPRVMALALIVAGLLVIVFTVLAARHIVMRLGDVEIARPPPAARRQALLGVFLS